MIGKGGGRTLTNCDGGDLGYFSDFFVGLHNSFYSRNGKFGFDVYSLARSQSLRLARSCSILAFDGGPLAAR
jgi:hypothetical protein